MFEGFSDHRVETAPGVTIRARKAGNVPPVLLLHGYPQTHACWQRGAPALVAAGLTVVVSDLRDYGDSAKPPSDDTHAPNSKRAMALDQVALMRHFGFARYHHAGHDRGGRVAHRLALDHPEAVDRLAHIDIAPTATVYARADRAFATGYYHWFFVIQPAPLPERLIGADPTFYLECKLRAGCRGPAKVFPPEALAEYRRAFDDPATIHAACEDYRASASIDLDHDAADATSRIAAPLPPLWAADGLVGRLYDVPNTWRDKARVVEGAALAGGHFLPGEVPVASARALIGFFSVGSAPPAPSRGA